MALRAYAGTLPEDQWRDFPCIQRGRGKLHLYYIGFQNTLRIDQAYRHKDHGEFWYRGRNTCEIVLPGMQAERIHIGEQELVWCIDGALWRLTIPLSRKEWSRYLHIIYPWSFCTQQNAQTLREQFRPVS